MAQLMKILKEDLDKWFKEKWVNIGKKVGGKHPPCGTSGKKSGYAKCVPAAKAAGMSKKEKESATRRKRAAQNKSNRGGSSGSGGKKPIYVSTKTKNEDWSEKYKKSINCNNPKGFSQKAHCQSRKKTNEYGINEEPRIPRKPGQKANSKKHSDLFTDENPKGTIKGLGFKNVEIAEKSVSKIENSGKSHAHKIQAAIALEQRARSMNKTSEAAVFRSYIEKMKEKTKNKKNENMANKLTVEQKIELFLEKNCPTDPGKWAASKAAAKSKFSVYPSAYANGWAAKNYKAKGGRWRTCKESIGELNALDECWDGYKAVGGKMKNGKMVPNCVPVKENIVNEEILEYDVVNEDDVKSFIQFMKEYTKELKEAECSCVYEAEYQGRKVQLGKPMAGDVKKFKVYVRNGEGNVVKVNFGQKGVKIKKSNPDRRKSFRARHNCDNPGPRWKARYWSCRKW
jgi:hypothetical protein